MYLTNIVLIKLFSNKRTQYQCFVRLILVVKLALDCKTTSTKDIKLFSVGIHESCILPRTLFLSRGPLPVSRPLCLSCDQPLGLVN